MILHPAYMIGAAIAGFTTSPSVGGAFYWTLRMGSGWDPRPTDAAPDGRQRDGEGHGSRR